jgi:hypothetical protein
MQTQEMDSDLFLRYLYDAKPTIHPLVTFPIAFPLNTLIPVLVSRPTMLGDMKCYKHVRIPAFRNWSDVINLASV